jgi:2-amino-4-hydroxy-6-hydroxymethyldihydropteridine diphosphokinase
MADVFLGLGSNLGDRTANIREALSLLRHSGSIQISKVSSLYEGEPVGLSAQPDFINCVARIQTELDPHALLAELKELEASLGREPDTHLKPRPIDIDILLYGDIDLESLDLMIPHSRLKARRFVLEPLLEIDPEIIDPVSSRPLREYLKDVQSQPLRKVLDSKEVQDA